VGATVPFWAFPHGGTLGGRKQRRAASSMVLRFVSWIKIHGDMLHFATNFSSPQHKVTIYFNYNHLT
jgi:hypothetical protein